MHTTKKERTFTFHNPAHLSTTKYMNNPLLNPRNFCLNIWTHQNGNFISIGSKGARDDAVHLVGRLVTSIAQTWRMILLDDEQVEKSGRFQS